VAEDEHEELGLTPAAFLAGWSAVGRMGIGSVPTAANLK